jgi:hypothetical protein
MIWLRQSTASQEIPLGRFLDSTDGNTEETALSIANTDIKLWKTGATTLASKNSGGATHIANGEYYCVLDATDTDTIGPMKVAVHVAGALAVQVWCCVLDEAVYDVMFGTTAPATTGNLTGSTVGTVTTLTNLPAITAGWLTAAGIAADAITAAKVAADVGTEIGTAVWASGTRTVTGFAAGLVHATTGLPVVHVTYIGAQDGIEIADTTASNVNLFFDNGGAATTATVASIDAAVSSRSSHAAADVWAVGTRTVTGGTITTLTGHTNQTGDAYAVVASGTHGNAALKTLIDALPTAAAVATAVWAAGTRVLTAATNLTGMAVALTTPGERRSGDPQRGGRCRPGIGDSEYDREYGHADGGGVTGGRGSLSPRRDRVPAVVRGGGRILRGR